MGWFNCNDRYTEIEEFEGYSRVTEKSDDEWITTIVNKDGSFEREYIDRNTGKIVRSRGHL